MTVRHAREAARHWIIEVAGATRGFCGAYTAGSTNWLADDAEMGAASDLDIMVVVAGRSAARGRTKFVYRGTLMEVSYVPADQFRSPEQILSEYHLAPSFYTARILLDPMGYLAPLQTGVFRGYAQRHWIRRRCDNARDKVVAHLRSIDRESPLPSQVMACLFAAGITTHILLAAGLRNPTVRTRYVAVRDLLSDYGLLPFHETLLELLGTARISRDRAAHHVGALTEIFDAAHDAKHKPFPFASDLSDCARPIAIDGSLDLIAQGYHREAMFWIAVTHARCQQALSMDVPSEVAADLGLSSSAAIQQRAAGIEEMLPRVCEVAGELLARNPEVRED